MQTSATFRQIPRNKPHIPGKLFTWIGFLLVLAVVTVLPLPLVQSEQRQDGSIKVGILHSLSGTMAISESQLKDAELLAIEEINAAGGVQVGDKKLMIEAVVVDPESKFSDVFPAKAEKLLIKDKVAAVFGCWTSVSRVNCLPVFEGNNGLLFYPVAYEGNECSWNCIYSGAPPNQQVLPAIDWLLTREAPRKIGINKEKITKFYLLGTNYIYPRVVNYIVQKHLAAKGVQPVAEQYVGFGHKDFANIVQDIKAKNPDVVISSITGDSNVNFYNELIAQGVTADKIPVVALVLSEDELRELNPAKVKGHLAARTYFQSLDTPANKKFVQSFQRKFGRDRVTFDEMAAAYAQVYLWKLAVEKARSIDVDKVREALRGLEFDAPEGKIRVDPKTQHVFKNSHMAKIRDDRQFEIIYSQRLVAPDPYPQVAFPGWSADLTKGRDKGITRGERVMILPR